ncbi:MAG: hypothetical protein ACYC8S_02385 [Minisyncoccota bacterium]
MESPEDPGIFEMLLDPSKAAKYLANMNAVEEHTRNVRSALLGVSLVLRNEEALFSFPQKKEAERVFNFLKFLSRGALFVTKRNLLCWGRLPENYGRIRVEFDVLKNIEELTLPRIDKVLLVLSDGKPNGGTPVFPIKEEPFKKYPPEVIILKNWGMV